MEDGFILENALEYHTAQCCAHCALKDADAGNRMLLICYNLWGLKTGNEMMMPQVHVRVMDLRVVAAPSSPSLREIIYAKTF
jgi:hypothetical protein